MPPNGKKLFTLKGQLRPPQSPTLDPLLIISSKNMAFSHEKPAYDSWNKTARFSSKQILYDVIK